MLEHVIASPMFDRRATLFGLPVDVVILGLGAVVWFVGFWALMRITRGEPTVRSFRATRQRDPAILLLWTGTAVFAGLAVVALVASGA